MKTKGLTLKEAIESGRPFKRAGWSRWAEVRDNPEQFIVDFEDHLAVPLGKADILATDWELKPDEPRKPREGYVFNGRFYEIHNGRSLLEDVNAPYKWERAFVAQEVLPGSRLLTREQVKEALIDYYNSESMPVGIMLNRLGFNEGDQS